MDPVSLSAKISARRAIFLVPVLAFACTVFVPVLSEAADLRVGPTRTQKTLAAGVSAAKAGDHIILDAGVYLDDTATVNVPLIIDGAGAVLRITKPIGNRKGILVVNADLTVNNLTFDGAQVTDNDGKNGAGIRLQDGDLTVNGCTFTNNQDGILANPNDNTTVTITRSTFTSNGAGDGYTHGIYINAVAQLTVTDSVFSSTRTGHDIKSRARKTTIRNTVLDDGVTGTSSYAIDLPNGGAAVLDGLRITQGPHTNNTVMIAYGAEGDLHPDSSLTVTNSTFINLIPTSTGVYNFTDIPAKLNGNTFQNVSMPLRGVGKIAEAVAVRDSAIASSAQPDAQSYLRFYNAGPNPGTVEVTLYNGVSGAEVVRWTSPTIPVGAAPQYSVADIEGVLAAGNTAKPAFYTATVTPQINGAFQHILYQPSAGALSNLTSCDSTTPDGTSRLMDVHASVLDGVFPSAVMVYNAGATAAAATIGVYDAATGAKIGSYKSATVPPSGQVVVPVATIEKNAQIVPALTRPQYNLAIEGDFAGTLRHLLTNVRPAIITDVTTACVLVAQ